MEKLEKLIGLTAIFFLTIANYLQPDLLKVALICVNLICIVMTE